MSLRVTPCSYQDGVVLGSATAPSAGNPVAIWRNNLTALSQTRNLLFIAFLDYICVYTPDFPDQAVAGETVGWIRLKASQPHLEGYIDEQSPQTANYITVKQFGDEEILLATCDSGDVIGYDIRAIEKALPQSPSPVTDTGSRYFYKDRSRQLFISPFFHENVGLSAWGVDVHSTARLIAVSSNTHNIIIFSFALSSSMECEMEMLDRVEPPDHMLSFSRLSSRWTAGLDYRNRDKNLVWALLGHTDNIPHVSFFNGQNEKESGDIYLASVDIYGCVQIWDVYDLDRTHTYSQAPEGWTATCMDPSICRIKNGFSPKLVRSRNSGSIFESLIQSVQEQDEEWREDSVHDSDLEPVPDTTPVTSEHSDEVPTLSSISADQSTITNERQGWTESVTDSVIEPFGNPLPFNLLCTSKRGIHAIQCSSTRDRNQLNLNGFFERPIPFLDRFQRLNMVETIPELGLVVVGNQAGDVALLTAIYEPKDDRYGYELDAILPTEAQRRKKQKPEIFPLMGISVGPVQGQLGTSYSPSPEAHEPDTSNLPRSERRYRLLLTYMDLTILSYELSRVDTTTEVLVI